MLVCRYYWQILAYQRFVSIGVYVLQNVLILKLIFEARKNTWTSVFNGIIKWFVQQRAVDYGIDK